MVNLSIQFSQGHGVYTVSICNTDATPPDILAYNFTQQDLVESRDADGFVEGKLNVLIEAWNKKFKPKVLLVKDERDKWTIITASYLDAHDAN